MCTQDCKFILLKFWVDWFRHLFIYPKYFGLIDNSLLIWLWSQNSDILMKSKVVGHNSVWTKYKLTSNFRENLCSLVCVKTKSSLSFTSQIDAFFCNRTCSQFLYVLMMNLKIVRASLKYLFLQYFLLNISSRYICTFNIALQCSSLMTNSSICIRMTLNIKDQEFH